MMRTILAIFFVMAAKTTLAVDPASTDVVVLHGKSRDLQRVEIIDDSLKKTGFAVDLPTLPWAATERCITPG